MDITDLTVYVYDNLRQSPKHISRPKWRSPEFIIYYIIFAAALPLMFWAPIRVSLPSHPAHIQISPYLSKDFLGLTFDNTDSQWRSVRANIPILACVALVWWGLSRTFTAEKRSPFLILASTIFLLVLHGEHSLKVFLLYVSNFYLTKALSHTLKNNEKRLLVVGPLCVWAFNLLVLVLVEITSGFSGVHLAPLFIRRFLGQGLVPRWNIHWNVTMLRHVSFACDFLWSVNAHTFHPSKVQEQRALSDDDMNRLGPRMRHHHAASEYSFLNGYIYTFYAPLYIAGPIMTFNDFVSQKLKPLNIPARSTYLYAARWLVTLLVMEFVTHTMFVVAIKERDIWSLFTPFEISMIGLFNLVVVWLKLLIPWRLFRLWALLDGVDPPENMIRCVANNYSTLGFWRSWHRSFNIWLVRYIYIPLGGGSKAIPATFLVFMFVALWHDLELRLLMWGWVVFIFILPELLARKLILPQLKPHATLERTLSALGGALNVQTMMLANLIGFVVGPQGAASMGKQFLFTRDGLSFLFIATACLFVGVQLMFEYREEELRHDIDRRC